MIIAIDGPSGTGKSTAAKGLAAKLGFTYLNTGLLYRALAYYCLQHQIAWNDEKALKKALKAFDVPEAMALMTPEVSEMASKVSVHPFVRSSMDQKYRLIGKRGRVVVEGRDTGTVIFPKADLKVFLTARPGLRAERRLAELTQKGIQTTLEEVVADQATRDDRDQNRDVAPLKIAPDAVVIDTSDLNAEAVMERLLVLVEAEQRCMRWFYRLVRGTVLFWFKLCYCFKTSFKAPIPPGGAILAANHASHFDPMVIGIGWPTEIHYLARETLFRGLLGRLIRRLNAHPIVREGADIASVRMIVEQLQRGNKVVIFPEGTRTHTGELQKPQAGIAMLAQRSGCPIIPIYLDGTFSVWNRFTAKPKPFGKVRMIVGAPIYPISEEGVGKKEAQRKLVEHTLQAIAALRPR